jgi:2-polyprenyl-3-methyl-5-hydroxy-6-metoxy-1,4-benzoquinol methylase
VKYGLLDISKDPGAQGFENNSFDMVLGLNVVHATPNVGDTIRNLKKLLVPNGAIALIEIVRSKRWHNMIWALPKEVVL